MYHEIGILPNEIRVIFRVPDSAPLTRDVSVGASLTPRLGLRAPTNGLGVVPDNMVVLRTEPLRADSKLQPARSNPRLHFESWNSSPNLINAAADLLRSLQASSR